MRAIGVLSIVISNTEYEYKTYAAYVRAHHDIAPSHIHINVLVFVVQLVTRRIGTGIIKFIHETRDINYYTFSLSCF